jgi:hypothetical protein
VLDTNASSREADVDRRAELHHLDSQLCNIRALFAIAAFTGFSALIFGALRGNALLAGTCALSVAVLGWCLVSQYKLMRKRDRIARTVSWIGLEKTVIAPRYESRSDNGESAQIKITEAA